MPIAVDATIGGETANSYAEIEEADAYFEPVEEFWTVWNALTADQQGHWLINGTRAIDALEYRFRGERVDVSTPQALAFPRDVQTDTAIIPTKVKHALFECVMARYKAAGSSASGQGESVPQEFKSVDIVGSVRVEWTDARQGQDTIEEFFSGQGSRVLSLLSEYLTSTSSVSITR